MGYYTTLTECNAYIPKRHVKEAYDILCALNWQNTLKSGGRHPRTCGCAEWKHTCEGPNENVWFSWMEWNYHETCEGLEDVLEQVGFDVSTELLPMVPEGVFICGYDSKTGDEEHFVRALSHLWCSADDHDPYFEWTGEDGYKYKWAFDNGDMVFFVGKTTWKHVSYS